MASHHLHYNHHHLHQQQQLLVNPGATSNCCCCNSYSQQYPQSIEPLLQAIVSQLLKQGGGGGGTCCQAQTHRTHQEQNFHQEKRKFQHQSEEKIILSSLLSRIDALEASLHSFSLSSTSNNRSSFTLRDIAARVIQTHFRAFLVRRSRTLRQLKELALIKSSFNSLRTSISKKGLLDLQVVSRKAMDLLLKLDSIQGFDPMIRDGKRSISNDLTKFLEFLDGFDVKRQEISCKPAKNVRLAGNNSKSKILWPNCRNPGRAQSEVMHKLRDRIENIHGFSRITNSEYEDLELEGCYQLSEEEEEEEEDPRVSRNKNGVLMKRQILAQPRMKKSVTFAKNGNVYRIFSNGSESISSGEGTLTDESISGDDNGQSTEVEEITGLPQVTKDEDNEEEVEESLQSSNIERNPTASLRREGRNDITGDSYNVEDGQFVFSAPVPLKMESKADLMKKRKAVKVVT